MRGAGRIVWTTALRTAVAFLVRFVMRGGK